MTPTAGGLRPQRLIPRHLDYPHAGLGLLVESAARAWGERDALVDGEQRLSFRGLRERALRIAQGLRERGVAPGDRVGLVQPNGLWFTVSYYAVLLAGAVVVPCNPTQPAAALDGQLRQTRVRAVIAHPVCLPAVLAAYDGPVVSVEGTAAAPGGPVPAGVVPLAELLCAEPAPATPRRPEDLAHLSFTGGTTGSPKAVRVLHRNVLANVLQVCAVRAASTAEPDGDGLLVLRRVPGVPDRCGLRPGRETAVSVSPLFHAMGLVSQSTHLLLGVTAVFHGRFEPARYVRELAEHRAGLLSGAPTMYHALLGSSEAEGAVLPSVRIVTSGAAPIDEPTRRRLAEVFPDAAVTNGYGLTEGTMAVSMDFPDPLDPPPAGSAGLPLPDTEVEIRDPAEPDRVLPVGETGVVWVRGPQVTAGYQDAPEDTAGQFGADGALCTGDIGRLDGEGRLFLSGRAKDMLIYKGYNVYPTQLEDVIAGHPAVAQCAVVGVPHPEAGEIPLAWVVPRTGAGAGGSPQGLPEELIGYVAERVAPYQRVREVRLLDALPVSAAGKVLKTRLRELAADPSIPTLNQEEISHA